MRRSPVRTLVLAFAIGMPCAASAQSTGLHIPTVTAAPPLEPTADLSAWKEAAEVPMPWDVQHQRPASEPSVARVATDGTYVYVRFDVKQREKLLAQQHTNDVGDGTDDEVWIDMWPNGSGGFYYQFAATSNGTHFQYSSENTAYSPTWESFGRAYDGGFTTTMKIPLKVMRGSGNSTGWKVQFVRIVRSTGERQIWSYGPSQTNGDDVTYAGPLTGIATAAASRPQPRIALYGLDTVASQPDLTSSRVGADLSIPVTATASVYATLHPDFSNVEVDQQTISPTAYQRSFNEVRPFFTQGASYYENFDCDACPFVAQLYTPSIPTPRDGYAFEGKQGQFSLAGFDALGVNRSDGAMSFTYRSPDSKWRFSTETVAANLGNVPNTPYVTDHVEASGLSYNDSKHIDTYFDYGNDSGTNVLVRNRAQHYDGGFYYYTNTFGIAGSMRKVGQYYNPVDGFVQHTDIAGYAVYENKVWLFSKNSALNSIQFGSFFDRYHASSGALNQTDNNVFLDVLTRNLIDVNLNLGSSYLLLNSGVFTPITQQGIGVTWHSGSYNNPGSNGFHGSSATPTSISYNQGRFGPGRVETWFRSSTMKAGNRGTLALEFDDTRDYLDSGGTTIQWLERLGYTYAAGPSSSLAIGVRRIIGTPPLFDITNPPSATSAWNLSFAYHRRSPHDELYFAYGDASQLSTVPQFLVKFIHYFGAEKGT